MDNFAWYSCGLHAQMKTVERYYVMRTETTSEALGTWRHNPMKTSDRPPSFPRVDLALVTTRSQKANRHKHQKTAVTFCRFVWSTNIELFLHLSSCDVDVYHTCNTGLTGRNARCHGSIRKGCHERPRRVPLFVQLNIRYWFVFSSSSFCLFQLFAFRQVQA